MWSFWTGFLPPILGGGMLVLVAFILLVETVICIAGSIMLWNDKRQNEKLKKEARRNRNG